MNAYRKGYCFEKDIQHELERKDWLVVRSAGSHGLFDLVAMKQDKPILLIQLKRKSKIIETTEITNLRLELIRREPWLLMDKKYSCVLVTKSDYEPKKIHILDSIGAITEIGEFD